MKWINESCLICIFLCVNFIPEVLATDLSETEFEQADSLFMAGNYFEAAIAYERIYFVSTQSDKRINANLKRTEALILNGQYHEAKADLQRSSHMRGFPELHFQVLTKIAFCDYMTGNYSSAISALLQISHVYPDKAHNRDNILLMALAAIMNENWALAQEQAFQLLSMKDIDSDLKTEWMERTTILFSEDNTPSLKSEKRASTLAAVLPGAGHIYSRNTGKGMINLSSQILSLGVAGMMGYHQLYISGFVIGLGMFQSFYFGGIRQATFLANQRNLKDMGNHKESLKNFLTSIYEL